MNKIKMLVVSKQDWNELYKFPDYVGVELVSNLENTKEKLYDLVFIDCAIRKRAYELLRKVSKAYTVFYTDGIIVKADLDFFFKSRKARLIKREDLQFFFDNEIINYFSKPYGEKFNNDNIVISQNFEGKVSWNGGYNIKLEGNFGDEFGQVLYWKSRIPIFKDQCIEFYLEYEKQGDVVIQLEIVQYLSGYVSKRVAVHSFLEDELRDLVYVDNKYENTNCFVSINAKGKGKLIIKGLHDRYSRRGNGCFLPGGERYVSLNGEEVFAYFDPGDLRPPLVVYFSGFKTQEGFEGYYAMKNLETPFLLFGEARLKGGAFYIGDDDYEKIYSDIIKSKLQEMGFNENDVILTGLSMGTTGAIYYAADIRPCAVVVGKPLINLGTIAKNELTIRPGYFSTSLDVLQMHTGGMSSECIERLDERILLKLKHADFTNTIFAVAYMIEDDYDNMAYQNFLDSIVSTGVTIYGKGIHGRHNDSSVEINAWFLERIKSVLRENYKREI